MATKCIHTYSWGEGKNVLLVHGWNGRATQLFRFIQPLQSRGFRVIGLDAPGHGLSTGKATNLEEFSQAINKTRSEYGHLHAIIAHSIGGLAALMAADNKACDRLVCINTPASLQAAFRNFLADTRMSRRLGEKLEAYLLSQMGLDYWERTSAQAITRRLNIPGLVVQDRHDKRITEENSARILKNWSGALEMITTGYGHTKILYAREVIDNIVEFVVSEKGELSTGCLN